MACETLLGVTLQPYWVIGCQVFLFFFLAMLWNLVTPYILCCNRNTGNRNSGRFLHIQSSNQIIVPIEETPNTDVTIEETRNTDDEPSFWDRTLVFSPLFFYIQYLFWWAHIIYIFFQLDKKSGWIAYQKLGTSVCNSGIASLIAAAWGLEIAADGENRNRNRDPARIRALRFVITPSSPFVLTHVLPMFFLYFPILTGLGFVCATAGYITGTVLYVCGAGAADRQKMGTKLIMCFAFILIMQTLWNYGVIVYASGSITHSGYWENVVVKEFNMRDSKCYWNEIKYNSESRLRFLSFL